MALPFLNSKAKKRDQIVAVDLGSRTTKAVYLQRKGDRYNLVRYAILDAPIYERGPSVDILKDHLKSIMQALEAKTRHVTLSIGPNESILRNAEIPQMPVSEMRQMLKFSTKTYLQQELPDYVFDCMIVAPRGSAVAVEGVKAPTKFKVWVGGAKNQLVDVIQNAVKGAGLIPDQLLLSIVGPVNAFEVVEPEAFSKESVALVDIGFRSSTINILSEGELLLSRVVGIGGDKLTTGLAESLGISYAEAEGIKVGMPSEVESSLIPLLSPLGREMRASIDFFEHQADKTISQVYVSGAAARSDFMLQALQSELMVSCKAWNPATFLSLAMPAQQLGELESVAPELTIALGAAAASI